MLGLTKRELLQLFFEELEIVGLDDGGSLAAMTLKLSVFRPGRFLKPARSFLGMLQKRLEQGAVHRGKRDRCAFSALRICPNNNFINRWLWQSFR